MCGLRLVPIMEGGRVELTLNNGRVVSLPVVYAIFDTAQLTRNRSSRRTHYVPMSLRNAVSSVATFACRSPLSTLQEH